MNSDVSMGMALLISLVSTLVVFVVLILIMSIINLLKNFQGKEEPLSNKKSMKNKSLPEMTYDDLDDEMMAVIAAAISYNLNAEIPNFRIKEIKKI